MTISPLTYLLKYCVNDFTKKSRGGVHFIARILGGYLGIGGSKGGKGALPPPTNKKILLRHVLGPILMLGC